MNIIPAIMPKSYGELNEQARKVRGLVKTVQVDIMDGIFVPEKSWPFREGGEIFQELVHGRAELPCAGELEYSADMMVVNSKLRVMNWMDAGFSEVIVHIGSTNEIEDIISAAKRQKVRIGIALKTTTPNEALEPWVGKVDFIQFMGIAQIGYQGEPFDERVIPKIKDLRAKYQNVTIQVDGGVSLGTAPGLLAAGADRLVVGSAIWKSGDVEGTIKSFQNVTM